jgi:hypothetical protein
LASSLSNFFNVLDGTSPSRRSNTTRRDVIDTKGPKLNLIIALPFCTSCGYLVLALRGYPSSAKQLHSGFFVCTSSTSSAIACSDATPCKTAVDDKWQRICNFALVVEPDATWGFPAPA